MKSKILIVEDESIEAMNFQSQLDSLGYEVVGVASSGADALQKVEETNPDLVLIDIVLKGPIDGIEVAQHIKGAYDIPVVYLTAHPEQSTLDRAKLTTPYGYLIKPVSKTDLKNTLELALYNHQKYLELKESGKRFRSVLDNTRDVIVRFNLQTSRYEFVSRSVIDLVGYPPNKFLEMDREIVYKMVHPDDLNVLKEAHLKSEKFGKGDAEYRQLTSKGEYIWVSNHMSVVKDSSGVPLYRDSVIRDITENKKAEEDLLESNERFQLMANGTPSLIFVDDAQGKHLFVNDYYLKFFNIKEEEVSKVNWKPFIHPDDKQDYLKKVKVAIRNHKSFYGQTRVLNGDGEWRWIETSAMPRFSANHKYLGHIGISMDITDRKKIEDELKEKEQHFRIVANYTYDWEYWIAPDGKIIYISPSSERITGYKPQEFFADPGLIEKIVHPDDQGIFQKHLKEIDFTEKISTPVQYRIITKFGEVKWMGHGCQPVYNDEGIFLGRRASNRDITRRKNTEIELRHVNEWLSFTQKSSKSGFWDWDMTTEKLIWSTEFYELFQLPPDKEASFDTWLEILHPDDRDPAMAKINQAIEEHEFLINQYRVLMPEGEYKWVRALGTTYYDDNGQPIRMSGICVDITPIKEEEEKHKKFELQYQSVFDNMLNGFAYCKMIYKDNEPHDFVYISVNKAFEDLTGLKNVDGKRVSQIIPDIQKKDHELLEIYGRVAGEGKPETFEIYMGSLQEWFHVSVYSPQGGYFVAIFDVITKRKNAEQELIESENRLRMLFERSNAVMLIIGKQGCIIDGNPSASKFYGYSLEELKTMNIGDINISSKEEIDKIRTMAINQEVNYFSAQHKLANGEIRMVEVSSSPIKFKEGVVLFSIINDITERIQAEDKIKSSLKEKELLLKEIHHRVKNNLQIISSLLVLQEDYVQDDPTAVDVLKESQNRVLSMAMIHEMLYQSKDLNSINLVDYIRNLVYTLLDSYGVLNIEPIIELDEIQLNIETSIPLGLILSELVSNSLKYAFPEKMKGLVKVQLQQHEDSYQLMVSDNGMGIPENVDMDNTTTLGLKLVNSLVSQLDGTINLERKGGTRFTINFRELEYEKRI